MHPPGDEVGLGPDIDTFDPGPKSSESSSNVSGNAKTKLVYELIVRQQPSRARMIGFGEKDRRPIDPPPIVQLRIFNENGDSLDVRNDDEETIVDGHLGSSMFNDPHLSATSMQGQHHEHQVQSGHAPQKSLSVSLGSNPPVALAQVLVGSLVSPCHVLADVDGTKGMFFVFSDISVRVGGKYRLKFLLYDVKPGDMSRFKASVMTDIFTVYHPKEFPGMADSTPLSKCLAKQGVRIHIRSHAEI
ncbi:velvet factor [Cladochytrium replicatum]|nr:velvet factor [Cladochytrium replicatum]